MISNIFLDLLNISIAAGWIVLAVVLLRLVLKKAPKWISCVLWSIVALRLMIPVHIQSPLSLIPSPEVIPQNITTTQTPAIYSGIPVVNSTVNPVLEAHAPAGGGVLEELLFYASVVWIIGVAVILLYGLICTLLLRRQVRASIKLYDRIYACDDVGSPFILGTLFPKIYVPSGMDEAQLSHVLAHEKAHLKRKDHWWKPLSFVLLSVYWFNPLMWLAYILLSRDIERACDEKVIAGMDKSEKMGYSEALVACSVRRRMIMVCPVAFGEVSVKTRIKGVLSYKKPAIWIILASAVTCVAAAVCFLTDPIPCIHQYQSKVTLSATCIADGRETLTCAKCQHSYVKTIGPHAHTYGDGVLVTAPTCTAQGQMEYSCTGCDKKRTEPVELLPHTAGEVTVTKAPNCTEKGEGATACTVCGTEFTVSLPTNDVHDLTETVIKAATCVETGEGLITCTRCTYEQKCSYELIKHHYEITYIREVYYTYREGLGTCTGCGDREWMTFPGGSASGNSYSGFYGSSGSYGIPNPEFPPQVPGPIIWDPNG